MAGRAAGRGAREPNGKWPHAHARPGLASLGQPQQEDALEESSILTDGWLTWLSNCRVI